MSTQKTIAMFAVLCLIALGLGYWVGIPGEGSDGGGKRNGGYKDSFVNAEGKEVVEVKDSGNGEGKSGGGNMSDSLKQGLVAYYPFDNHVDDMSGNGFHASGPAGYTIDRFQSPNSAIQTTNKRINLPPAVIRKMPESGSISVWFQKTKNAYGYVFYSGEGGKFNSVRIKLTESGQVEASLGRSNPSPSKNWSKVGASFLAQSDKWYHVVLLWRDANNNAEFYVNGVSLGMNHGTYRWTGAAQNDGVNLGGDGYAYDGNRVTGISLNLDDLRIYNRALSEAEIKALYKFEKPKDK